MKKIKRLRLTIGNVLKNTLVQRNKDSDIILLMELNFPHVMQDIFNVDYDQAHYIINAGFTQFCEFCLHRITNKDCGSMIAGYMCRWKPSEKVIIKCENLVL